MLKEDIVKELKLELEQAKIEHDRLALIASKALHVYDEAEAPVNDTVEKDFIESKHNLDDQRRYVKRLSKLLKQHNRMTKPKINVVMSDGAVYVIDSEKIK